MADRYWISGVDGALWTNTANWSATAGGPGGASVPTANDQAFVNFNITARTTILGMGGVTLPTYMEISDPVPGSRTPYEFGIIEGPDIVYLAADTVIHTPVLGGEGHAFFTAFRGLSGASYKITKTGPGWLRLYYPDFATIIDGFYITQGYFGAMDIVSSAAVYMGVPEVTPATPLVWDPWASASANNNNFRLFFRYDCTIQNSTTAAGGPTQNFTNTWTFDAASTPVLTFNHTVNMSGPLAGTSGFTKSGAAAFTLTSTAGNSTLSGNVQVTQGILSIRSNILQNATVLRTGTVGTLTIAVANTQVGMLAGEAATPIATTLVVGSSAATVAPNLSGTYSGVLSGAGIISKQGTGTWTLSGANTRTGNTTIDNGVIAARSAAALGATTAGDVSITAGTLDVSANTALNKSTRTLTLNSVSGSTAVRSTSGSNSITCAAVALASTSTISVEDGASLTLNNTAAIADAGGARGLTKTGAGELTLAAVANTFSGRLTIANGSLSFSSVASLGTGASDNAVELATGSLVYTGASDAASSRTITFTGATAALSVTGAGELQFSSSSHAAGARTITLAGTNTKNNRLGGGTPSQAISVVKTGSGTWVLAGATQHTGTTQIEAGTLSLDGSNRSLPGGVTLTAPTATLANSSGTVESALTFVNGGQCAANLTGSSTVSVVAGSATLSAAELSYTGLTSMLAGTLDLGGISRTLPGGVSITSGTLQNGPLTAPVTSLNGIILTALEGLSTLDVPASGDTSVVTSDSNTFSGGTTVAAGAVLRLTTFTSPSAPASGRVLGTGTTTVSGTLSMGSPTTIQRGQMRYGGDVVFNSGAMIYPGYA